MGGLLGLWAWMLVIGVGGRALYEWWRDRQEWANEARRLAERTALRQRYVGTQSDSPVAWEGLGDALRSAGDFDEALNSYLSAKEIVEKRVRDDPNLSWMQNAGLEQKIRIMRLELSQRVDPAAHGLTLATRDQVCRRCGTICPGAAQECGQCGNLLAVDNVADIIRNDKLREWLKKDTKGFAIKLGVIVLAIGFAWAQSFETLVVVVFASVIVLAFLFLKNLGDPKLGD